MTATTDTARTPLLIGLIGNAGTGKDTVAAFLEDEHAFQRIGFADPILHMVLALFDAAGVDGAWAVDRTLKEVATPVLRVSYRRLAQTLGTQWGREQIGADLWLRVADHALQQCRLQQHDVVISDVRFANEAAWITAQGGTLVRVQRRDTPAAPAATAAHVSETELAGIQHHHHLDNNGSLATLFDQVDELLHHLRRA